MTYCDVLSDSLTLWAARSHHCYTPAHFVSLVTGLSCAPDHSSNAFALTQVVSQSKVACDMIAECCWGMSRVETLEDLRGQAQYCDSSSSGSSSRILSRHGHHNRLRNVPPEIGTRNDRCDTAVESGCEWINQWQNRHIEQHKHSTPECQQKQLMSSHIESVISFQETGKTGTKKDNSEASCQTDTCACKRCWIEEKNCMSVLRASTSSTAVLLHLILRRRIQINWDW